MNMDNSFHGWTLLTSPNGSDQALRHHNSGLTIVPIRVFLAAHPEAIGRWNKMKQLIDTYGSYKDRLGQAVKHFFPGLYSPNTNSVNCYRVQDLVSIYTNNWLTSLLRPNNQSIEDELKTLWLESVKKAYIEKHIVQWEAEVRAEIRQHCLAMLDE